MKPNGMCMMHRLSTCPAIFADLLDGGKHSAHTLKDDIQAFRMEDSPRDKRKWHGKGREGGGGAGRGGNVEGEKSRGAGLTSTAPKSAP